MVASFGHVSMMPYLDLTMMGCNAAFAIGCSMVLSAFWLGERFVPLNDITALFFISAGCVTIVCNVSTDAKKFDSEEAVEHLLSWRSIGYYTFTATFVLLTLCFTKFYLIAVRQFELDVEKFDNNQNPINYDEPSGHDGKRILKQRQ